jgi:hypothetical protein
VGLAHKRCRVHLKDGKTVEGILLRKRPDVVLELAEQILGDEARQIDGRARIPRENVSFWQELR